MSRRSYGQQTPLAQTIRSVREELGLRRKEFAARVGVRDDDVAHIESGQRLLSVERAVNWARAFGFHDHYFLVPMIDTHVHRINAATRAPVTPVLSEYRPQRGGWR